MESVENRRSARLYSLDGLRGVMCIGIALYHYVPYFFSKNDLPYDVSRYFAYFTDIFFVFGGFFAGKVFGSTEFTSKDYVKFLLGKLSRLYPLHIVTFGFYFVISLALLFGIAHPANESRYDPGSIISHLTLTHSMGFGNFITFNYPSWAISAIFGCCILLPLVRVARGMSSPGVGLFVILVLVLVICVNISDAYASHITMMQEETLGVVRCAPSFIFGVFLAWNRNVKMDRRLSIAILIVSCLFLFGLGRPMAGIPRLVGVYAFVFAIVAIDVAGIWTPLQLNLLRRVSKYSFGIYLIHSVVATILFQILVPKITGMPNNRLGDSDPLDALSFLLLGLVLTGLLAVLSLKTIEPFGDRAFKYIVLGMGRRVLKSRRAIA